MKDFIGNKNIPIQTDLFGDNVPIGKVCPIDNVQDLDFLIETIKQLWAIIDDIDTASDLAKYDDISYRNMTEFCQKKRWNTNITSDGYNLFRKL